MFSKFKIWSLFLIIVTTICLWGCKNVHSRKVLNMPSQLDVKLNKKDSDMHLLFSCSVAEGINLPTNNNRGGHIGGVINNKVIISGGTRWSKDKTAKYFLNNSLIFENQEWLEGPSLPIPLAYSIYAYDSSGLYVAGGTSDGLSMLKNVYVLKSIRENTKWERLPDLPEAIGFGAGAILNDRLYVCGGLVNEVEKTNRMWVLNLKKIGNGWNECKEVPGVPRMLHSMVASGRYLFLLGGLADTNPLTPLNDIFRYDPQKNKWVKLDNLPLNGYAWVSQPIDEKNILITGRADGLVHSDIWIIDLEALNMKKIGDLIIPSTTAPLIKVSDNQWWLIGGEPDSYKNRTGIVSIINLKK